MTIDEIIKEYDEITFNLNRRPTYKECLDLLEEAMGTLQRNSFGILIDEIKRLRHIQFDCQQMLESYANSTSYEFGASEFTVDGGFSSPVGRITNPNDIAKMPSLPSEMIKPDSMSIEEALKINEAETKSILL